MSLKTVHELIALAKDLPGDFGTTIQGDLKSLAVSGEARYEICFLVSEAMARKIIAALANVGQRSHSTGTNS
jgi:hypothetical protein